MNHIIGGNKMQKDTEKIWGENKIWADFLGKLFHHTVFSALYDDLKEKLGPDGAADTLKDIMKNATENLLKEDEELRKLLIPEDKNDLNKLVPCFNFCYNLFAKLGYKYDYEYSIEGSKYTLKIKECPNIKFTKERPNTCFACLGLKMGILNTVFGRIPDFDIKKRIVSGEDYCEIEVKI